MKILVTGGAGFVGASFMRKAVADGHDVINFDALTASATLSDIWDLEESPNYQLVPGDICDGGDIADLAVQADPDAIVHLAHAGPDVLSDDLVATYMNTNFTGALNVIQAAKVAGTKRLIIPHRVPDTSWRSSLFAASKDASAVFLNAALHQEGIAAIQSFAPTVFGPRQGGAAPLSKTVRKFLSGETVPVKDGPRTALDLLYVDDYAQQLLDLTKSGVPGRRYALKGPRMIRPMGVARMIAGALNAVLPSPLGNYMDQIDIQPVDIGSITPPWQLNGAQQVLGMTPYRFALKIMAQGVAKDIETKHTRKRAQPNPQMTVQKVRVA
ncbi:MAG: NAD-dependent epimerase/dehydratase family protein [Planktomarina sp.]